MISVVISSLLNDCVIASCFPGPFCCVGYLFIVCSFTSYRHNSCPVFQKLLFYQFRRFIIHLKLLKVFWYIQKRKEFIFISDIFKLTLTLFLYINLMLSFCCSIGVVFPVPHWYFYNVIDWYLRDRGESNPIMKCSISAKTNP